MKIKIPFSIIVSLISFLSCQAQSLYDFRNGRFPFYEDYTVDGVLPHWGFALSYAALSNPAAAFSGNHHKTGVSLVVDYKKYHVNALKTRMYFRNNSLGDLLLFLGRQVLPNSGSERPEGSILTNLFGWTSWGLNLAGNEIGSLGTGFNINDFIAGSTTVERIQGGPDKKQLHEPQGYYWAAGPSVFLDFAITDNIVVQTFGSYSLPLFRAASLNGAEPRNSYPKPHFARVNLEILTLYKLFAGVDYTWMINRGNTPNKTQRLDVFIGYRL